MNDPKRLLLEPTNDLERELLEAWSSRQPSAQAHARALALVGATVSLGAITAGMTATKATAPAILKWLVVSVIGVGAIAGGVAIAYRLSGSTTAPPSTGATTIAQPLPPSTPIAPHEAPTTPQGTPPTTPPATIELAPTEAVPPTAKAMTAETSSAHPKSTLADELTRIDRAEHALSSGDPTGALRLVDGYDATYPNGSLAQESSAIRIEALVRRGERAQAEKLASAFIAAHPSSPYARRVRELVEH